MPERIVIGLSPETFNRTYESHVITLAGAAVAAMAGFGNDEPALADAALRVALDSSADAARGTGETPGHR